MAAPFEGKIEVGSFELFRVNVAQSYRFVGGNGYNGLTKEVLEEALESDTKLGEFAATEFESVLPYRSPLIPVEVERREFLFLLSFEETRQSYKVATDGLMDGTFETFVVRDEPCVGEWVTCGYLAGSKVKAFRLLREEIKKALDYMSK